MKKIYLVIIALFALNTVEAQYTIDFDSFTTGDVTPQTTHIILWPAATATEPQVSTTHAHSAPNSMWVRPNSTTTGIADDVLFQLGNKDSGIWRVSFWVYVPSGQNGYFNIQEHETGSPAKWNGEFFIGQTNSGGTNGVISHNSLTSTAAYPNDSWFQVVITVNLDISEISVDVDGNPMFQNEVYQDNNGVVGLQLGAVDFYSVDSNTSFYIDDFELFGCNFPTNLVLDTVTDSTADISWGPTNETNGYSWMLMADGDDPLIDTPLQSGTTPTGTANISLTGLTPFTEYDFYVMSDCGSLQSNYGSVLDFKTKLQCNVSGVINSFPYTEGFELSSTSIGCWTQIQELGAADWVFAEGSSSNSTITTAYSGVQNARFVSENDIASPVTKLVSPQMDLTSLPNPELSFYYAQENWLGDYNHLKVYYRGNDTDAWVELAYYDTNVDTWTQEVISLPNPTATYQIAFEGINYFGHANVVDEVMVDEGLSVASQVFESFSFYPNPVQNQLVLNSVESMDQVEIHDLLGKKIFTGNPGQKEFKLDVSTLPSGIYLMKVEIDGKSRMFKVLKE